MTKDTRACGHCGKPVEARRSGGRTAEFCSTACRVKAHRAAKRKDAAAMLWQFTCPHCGHKASGKLVNLRIDPNADPGPDA